MLEIKMRPRVHYVRIGLLVIIRGRTIRLRLLQLFRAVQDRTI